MDRRALPIGIDDFRKVKKNHLYVDKTFFVKDIVHHTPSSAILFARPSGYGKSLALSMLRCFFEISEEDKTSLFADTEIYGDKEIWEGHFSSYPVIHLDFSKIKGEDKESLLSKTKECIKDEYRRHSYLLGSEQLSDFSKKYIEGVLSSSLDEVEFSSSLSELCRFLSLHHKKDAVILIDEYDAPIREAYEKGFLKEVSAFFQILYGQALKGNEYLQYGILTGYLEIGRDSLFSGLNNLNVYDVLDPFFGKEAFGFSLEETNSLLDERGMGDLKEEFRKWYGGYLIGGKETFGPSSVLKAIENGKMAPYRTASEGVVKTLLEDKLFDMDTLCSMLNDEEIRAEIDLSISYKDIHSHPYNLLSYLVATGYLTAIDRISMYDYVTKIPNKEILETLKKELFQRYLPNDWPELYPSFSDALLSRDEEKIKSLIKENGLSSFSYYELNREKEYQAMVVALLASSLGGYRIRREVNAGLGRSDIIAYGDANEPSIIIEIKSFKGKTSSKRLKEASMNALQQIIDRDYVSELSGSKSKRVICYGWAFASKSIEISSQEIEL